MKYLLLTFLVLVSLNFFVWSAVASGWSSDLDIYFLDVGQGDSQLIVLPGGAKILIDGGPGKDVLFELAEVLPQTDRYIDLIVVTHPQLDHFGGLYDVVERYDIGALIVSGRDRKSESWKDFVKLLKDKNVNVIFSGAGDVIRYKDSSLLVLNPDEKFLNNPELNESSIVLGLESEKSKSLFTGDIGFETENYLVDKYDIDADVLKVAHHGSRFSTGLNFLNEVTPEISIIEVGKNRFGHPTNEALSRLKSVNSSIYRTDKNGRVHLKIDDGIVKVFSEN